MGITHLVSDNDTVNRQNYSHNHNDGDQCFYPSQDYQRQHQQQQHTNQGNHGFRSTSDIFSNQVQLPPNTGPAGTVAVTNGSNSTNNKNLSHVPCKFFKQGVCQAGNSCPFSHNLEGALGADKLPCKYFQKGNCKFGLKCALAHFLPDGTRVNSKSFLQLNGNGKPNNHRGSFGSYTASSYPIDYSPPEYEKSFVDANNNGIESSPSNTVFATQNSKTTSFINIGNGTSSSLQQQYQQPISLSSVPQESLDRSRSFNRSNSLQNIPQPDNTPSSPYSQQPKISHQRSLSMQHHPIQYFTHNANVQASPQETHSATTPTSRFSFNSRLSSQQFIQQQQQQQQSSSQQQQGHGYYYTESSSSAIVDDDDYPAAKNEFMFEEDFIPGSLSDVILTPQELKRRDSRSQSGNLNVRPSLNNLFESQTQPTHDNGNVFLMD
ncbi:Zinc finger C-x8-C-x5-C-x3-H type (and similar) family protein [Candida albicans]|uniref:Zinc finger C-x8-C-x5-C-x3-H type (And similar) family protein n=1 Tax=Candida albicans TaxID=5476 RepID=A0A8H6C2X6_CANAX|nr:Zinc finger C-x8-C-x5-C-x3-H type (and similar) family protein [Candida albicans]